MSDVKHVSVDLETWGLTPGSEVRSIGAVVFDPVTGTIGDRFYVNLFGGQEFELTKDRSTVDWWNEQSDEAKNALLVTPQWITTALANFSHWWNDLKADGSQVTFWANGPSFDEAILAAVYRAVGYEVPWNYRAPRCVRTIVEAALTQRPGCTVEVPFEGVSHNALDDALYQAAVVIKAYKMLGINWENGQ